MGVGGSVAMTGVVTRCVPEIKNSMSSAQVGRCRRGSRCQRSVVVLFVCIEWWIGGSVSLVLLLLLW